VKIIWWKFRTVCRMAEYFPLELFVHYAHLFRLWKTSTSYHTFPLYIALHSTLQQSAYEFLPDQFFSVWKSCERLYLRGIRIFMFTFKDCSKWRTTTDPYRKCTHHPHSYYMWSLLTFWTSPIFIAKFNFIMSYY
jgi:hypothetical protein